jgi:conjugal transfer pilus assembly protein TraB
MVLLSALLTGALLLVTNGWAGRKQAEEPTGPKEVPGPLRKDDLPPSPSGFDESLPVAQQYKALVSSYGERVSSTEKELEKTRKEIEVLRGALQEAQGPRKKDEPRVREREAEEHRPAEAAPAQPPLFPPAPEKLLPTNSPSGLRTLEFSPSPTATKTAKRSVHVTAATAGEATLLNGVFAPVSGDPSPVRLRFDAALLGPNKSRVPIRDALLIGKASGDANSLRVTVQVEKLAYVKATGEPVEAKVLGYVVGDDGLEGVPGSYEWRAWEVLPLAAVAGGVSFGTDALAQRETTTSVTPFGGATNIVTGDPLKFAGFRAASGASGKLGELLTERLREIRPAISTAANRRVQVVFLDGVTLEGLNVEDIDYGRDYDPFHGLDLHR